MDRIFVALGAVAGAAAVAMSAVAAHGLDRLDASALRQLRDAIQLQGWHALALVAAGLWAARGGRFARAAGVAFALGIVAFCGAVYALALGGVRLPGVAPTGGMLLIAGWLLLAVSALRAR